MEEIAFIPLSPAAGLRHRPSQQLCKSASKLAVTGRRQRRASVPSMQLPPETQRQFEPSLSEEQRGPPGYKWDPEYPGTLKPGSVDDNFPLRRVLESDVYERMQYEEIDMDDRQAPIFPPDEDFLQWLAQEGRLLPREMSDEDFNADTEKQISGITEDDLEFSDDDSKMIAYYSRQGEGAAAGAGSDFGGFSESSIDVQPGF